MLSSAQADLFQAFWPESSSHVNVKATRLKHINSGLEMSFAIYNGLFSENYAMMMLRINQNGKVVLETHKE